MSVKAAARWAAVALMGAAACRPAVDFSPPPPPKVTIAKPLVQTVVSFVELPGQTRAVESVEVRARVEGFLRTVEFVEGAEVAQGDLLYTIEPERFAALVKTAEARLANARAALVKAEFDRERIRKLQESASASESEWVLAQANYDQAQAAVTSAEADRETAQLDLQYTRITAPIAGRINRTRVNAGNLVGRGEQTLLTSIVPWDPMHVYVTVGERDVLQWRRRMARGDTPQGVNVYLRLTDGTDYTPAGRIDYVDNQVDERTGTLQVRAIVENPDGLLVPGIFVRVRIPREAAEAVLVPESALQRDLLGSYVYTVSAAGATERADVVTGPKIDNYRVIDSGLSGDLPIIISGVQRVQPGMRVDAELVTLRPLDQPGLQTVTAATAAESAASSAAEDPSTQP